MRPFRFGVVGESIRSGEQLVATARRAEDLGYDTLLLRDHFVREPYGDQLAPLIALGAAAAATRRLRVGTLVIDNDYRHPVLLAKEAATLDHLYGERFELGIGAGWLKEEYEQAGMSFDPAGVRVGRLEESLQILKSLLSGGKTTFAGEHYRVTDLECFPVPERRPRILVGAGSRRMLGLAGRAADIVGVLPKALPDGTISAELSERSPEMLLQKVEWVREGAEARFDEVELSMIVSVTITDDPEAAARRRAADRGWGTDGWRLVLDMPATYLGPVAHIADLMRARRDRFGFSYLVVSDEDMEAVAPVVQLMSGQ
ncbi:MAG TPA: TIGR03621 family F420-dependent LLM class oxidoreductase [Streptosporangiaceae bacterium]|jgi:probable F420-dependent oxidoreductase